MNKKILEFETKFDDICNVALSDFVLSIILFNGWKDSVYNYAVNCRSDRLQTYVDNYILCKEEVFKNFLMNIPEYRGYYC